MSTAIKPPWPACPTCGEDLGDADPMLGPGVPAQQDPEGKARIELILTCYSCEAEFFAFVAVSDFQEGAR